MKHLYNIFFLLAVFAFASCTPEVDDVFDETASARIKKAIEEDLNILQGAKNGWVIEYYPSATRMYGGYTILVSFDENENAKVSCDIFKSDMVVESKYRVIQSTGPTLTFDTYNEIFHLFSEPSNIFGIGDSGKGMEGDYEFLILECTPEKVVLKGKKTANKMVMTPMPESKTWKQYLDEVKGITGKAYPALYDVSVGGESKYKVTQKYHKFTLTNTDGSSVDLPFVYTEDGIKFYEPVSIGNTQMQSLTWDNDQMAYINGDIAVKSIIPDGYKPYDEYLGSYILTYNGQKVNVALGRVENDPFNTLYVMKGFPYEIMVTYDAAYGRIGFETQMLTSSIGFLPWSLGEAGSGPISTGTGVGMIGIYGDDGVINFVDNGVWGSALADSFIIYNLVTGQPILRIPYLENMVKQ